MSVMKYFPFHLLIPLNLLLADWPQYHGPFHDKSSAIKLENAEWISQTATWTTPTPLGFSSFSCDSRSIYTIIAEEDEDGLLREVCLALDPKTGNTLWKSFLGLASYGHAGGNAGTTENSGGDGPRSTPSVKNEIVFVYDSNMVLHALSSSSGKPLWKADLIRQFMGENIMWKNASSPLLVGELVIVCGGGKDQSFVGFEQKDGKVRWKSGNETPTHATPVLATIHGKQQVIFLCRSGLVSIDPLNGKEVWKQSFPFKVSSAASPVIAGDLVFCSAGYGVGSGLFRINKKGTLFRSEEVWRKRNELMNHWSTPLHHNGFLYGIFGFKEYGKAPLQCVELATGEIRWSKQGFGPGNIIRSGDLLFVLSDDGQVVCVTAKPDSYHELVRKKILNGKCWSTPIICKNHLIARSTREGVAILVSRE